VRTFCELYGSARFSVSLFVTTPPSGYNVLSPSKETGFGYSLPKAIMAFIAADRVLSGSGESPGAGVNAEQVTGGATASSDCSDHSESQADDISSRGDS
jgi:hypothetical protein